MHYFMKITKLVSNNHKLLATFHSGTLGIMGTMRLMLLFFKALCFTATTHYFMKITKPVSNNHKLLAKFHSGTLRIMGTTRLMSPF